MVLYLAVLLAWSAWHFGEFNYLWKGILIVAFYAAFDVSWTYFRDKVWYFPESSLISGLILALIGAPAPSWDLIFLMPLLAVVSKQLFRLGKGRHIFNPAAFSLVVLSLAGYDAVGWWAPSLASGGTGIWFITLAGLFILWRQRRWETALPFLAAYALLLNFRIFDGTVVFFTTVMLIEPITSNFPDTRQRMAYGVLVAILAFLIGKSGFDLDPLLIALLGGNIIISLLTAKIIKKQ